MYRLMRGLIAAQGKSTSERTNQKHDRSALHSFGPIELYVQQLTSDTVDMDMIETMDVI